jgi:hypothetical protein
MASNQVTETQTPARRTIGRTTIVFGVIALVALMCACGGLVALLSNGSHPATNPIATTAPAAKHTAAPTVAPTWHTVATLKGNGSGNTENFTVDTPAGFRMVWSADPTSFDNIQFNMIVSVYQADGTEVDFASVNALVQPNGTNDTGIAQEHNISGALYLNVACEGTWTIQVQELK